MNLTDRQRSTLTLICDTLFPDVGDGSDFYRRKAPDMGVDTALARVIEESLQPGNSSAMARLLDILENPILELALSRKPRAFSKMSLQERTELLRSWRDSPLMVKRTAFQAIKRIACFLSYTVQTSGGINPNWSEIGYPGPDDSGRVQHPQELTVKPLIPEEGSKLEAEVCVVGSGAGGSVIAYELSKAGHTVIVLEQGSYETSTTFIQDELQMMQKLFQQQGTASTSDLSFTLLAGRGAGGGTIVNWNTCLRTPEPVLKEWQEDYGIQDLLSPHFRELVEQVWSTLRVNTGESQRNSNNQALWDGCLKLGYTEGTDFEVINRNAVGCRERCDFCNMGCIYACKQSTIMNYIPMAYANSAKFIFNCRAERVLIEGDEAKGVAAVYAPTPGKTVRFEVKSKVVVAACGSIETPALLLRSGVKDRNVGRNLRLHPTAALSGIFEHQIQAWKGPPQTVAVRKFINRDGNYHGFWIEAAPAHPGLFAFTIPWSDGKSHKDFMKKYYTRAASPIVLVREWGGGIVSIDKQGFPVVFYDLDQRDKSTMMAGMEEIARILVAAGATEIWSTHNEPVSVGDGSRSLKEEDLDSFNQQLRRKGIGKNRMMLFSAHIMGSVRMSQDSSQGPTRPTGELHSTRNLYIGDASVFPTSPGVNPMISIMSMSKRTSEFIISSLSSAHAS
ncbi:MAG: GMC family oxidoreductase N-terminal domain-containing protein [Nitrososphaerota archaeon]|nr:GMC family oxidoreductase N-terminal domain-containing protein [Nitrososphaerota archaeon]